MSQSVTPSSPLFRNEVTAEQSQQWMGAIRLAQPVSSWLIALVATCLSIALIALIAYITLGSITKKARVTGLTLPVSGSLSVIAPGTGVLRQLLVKEGQLVQAGQALFELNTERMGDQGEITALIAQQLAARQHSLETEQRQRSSQTRDKKSALQSRLSNLQTEQQQLNQEITLAQQSLHKFEQLEKSGYVSTAQTQQKQEELLDLSSRLSTLQCNQLQLAANQLALRAELTDLDNQLANDQAQLARSLASLKQESAENSNRKSTLITAPQDGIVSVLSYAAGQTITAGQNVLTLLPKQSELEVQLYAPSRTAGFVSAGQTVLIRYQAFPYQKFGLQQGTVTDVSSTPIAPNELPTHLASTILSNAQQSLQGFNSNEALYRIKVRLAQQNVAAYGQNQPLKPGMTLE
ncbi:HlyD family secretion protein, partial [Undibacterium curvum]